MPGAVDRRDGAAAARRAGDLGSGRAHRRRGHEALGAAAARRGDLGARGEEGAVVDVPARGEVAAGGGRRVEVVVAAAVVGLRDRAADARAVVLHGVRRAGVLRVTHDVRALPAVAVAGEREAGGLGAVGSRPLDRAEVVADLVQEALRPPAARAGVGGALAVAGEEDRGEAAEVVDVGRATAVARRAEDVLAEAVVVGAAVERVGEDDHVARAGRGPEARLDLADDGAEVVDVGAPRAAQVDDLEVDELRAAARAHVDPDRLRAAALGSHEALDEGDVGLQRVGPLGEAVGAVGGVGVDELEAGGAGRQRVVRGAVRRAGLAAPGVGERAGRVGGGRGGGDVDERELLTGVAVGEHALDAVGRGGRGRQGGGQERQDGHERAVHTRLVGRRPAVLRARTSALRERVRPGFDAEILLRGDTVTRKQDATKKTAPPASQLPTQPQLTFA